MPGLCASFYGNTFIDSDGKMRGILVDENLPKTMILGVEYTHATELGQKKTDTELWEYAKKIERRMERSCGFISTHLIKWPEVKPQTISPATAGQAAGRPRRPCRASDRTVPGPLHQHSEGQAPSWPTYKRKPKLNHQESSTHNP